MLGHPAKRERLALGCLASLLHALRETTGGFSEIFACETVAGCRLGSLRASSTGSATPASPTANPVSYEPPEVCRAHIALVCADQQGLVMPVSVVVAVLALVFPCSVDMAIRDAGLVRLSVFPDQPDAKNAGHHRCDEADDRSHDCGNNAEEGVRHKN